MKYRYNTQSGRATNTPSRIREIHQDRAAGWQKRGNMENRRRRWTLLLTLLFAGGFIWVAWAFWQSRLERDAIAKIESEMMHGRFGTAARELVAVINQRPHSDKAAYLLGVCEKERAHYQEAIEAWQHVTPGSEFSLQAIRARLRLTEDRGQLADAERMIGEAANDPRNDATELRAMLVPMYSQLGRQSEAERLIEARWEHLNAIGEGASEEAIVQLQRHIVLTLRPNSVENIRNFLDGASRRAPQDDRVWLGQANLGIRTGDYDDAKRQLDACLERRPDDVPVWRARLDWGVAVNKIDAVKEALPHLPAAESTPAQLYLLSAWLCAERVMRLPNAKNSNA